MGQSLCIPQSAKNKSLSVSSLTITLSVWLMKTRCMHTRPSFNLLLFSPSLPPSLTISLFLFLWVCSLLRLSASLFSPSSPPPPTCLPLPLALWQSRKYYRFFALKRACLTTNRWREGMDMTLKIQGLGNVCNTETDKLCEMIKSFKCCRSEKICSFSSKPLRN